MLLKNIQLVVSRLFAGDNRLSPDILLVTTCCQQTKKSGDNRLSADLALYFSRNMKSFIYRCNVFYPAKWKLKGRQPRLP